MNCTTPHLLFYITIKTNLIYFDNTNDPAKKRYRNCIQTSVNALNKLCMYLRSQITDYGEIILLQTRLVNFKDDFYQIIWCRSISLSDPSFDCNGFIKLCFIKVCTCSQNVSDLLKRLQTFTRCFMSLDCRTLVNTISEWESVTLLACTFCYKLQLFVGWQFMFYIIYLPMPFSFFCRR